MGKKVVVLPCSGIGKAYGEIGRQAVYELAEDLKPEDVKTACLARLMIDDPETKALVKENFVITVDGCALDCARKNVEATGKQVDSSLRVVEAFKKHRDLKPQGVLELGEPGFKLAHILAERLSEEVDCVMKK
jgi:uncharacterized metal-binding protein